MVRCWYNLIFGWLIKKPSFNFSKIYIYFFFKTRKPFFEFKFELFCCSFSLAAGGRRSKPNTVVDHRHKYLLEVTGHFLQFLTDHFLPFFIFYMSQTQKKIFYFTLKQIELKIHIRFIWVTDRRVNLTLLIRTCMKEYLEA
jgi:hypothetical protein